MSFAQRFLQSRQGMAGLVILAALALAALSAPLVFPADPQRIAASPLIAPFADAAFPLGTDRLGRDVLAGLLHGARASLFVGFAAACAALTMGIVGGTVAGFAGGLIDEALMRVVDAFQIVPGFLLALAFASVIGPSLPIVVLAIALSSWAAPARLMRAQVLSIRERDYVASARVIGMHPAAIAFRQILPAALPPVLALAAVIVAGAILTEAALSFLGLGDPNIVTWGSMIAEGRNVLRSAPWLCVIPGIALMTAVLGSYLLGEGINEILSGRRERYR